MRSRSQLLVRLGNRCVIYHSEQVVSDDEFTQLAVHHTRRKTVVGESGVLVLLLHSFVGNRYYSAARCLVLNEAFFLDV